MLPSTCPRILLSQSSGEIILLALINRCYHQRHWTAFVGAFQFLALTPLIITAHILLVNILASAPAVRTLLLSAGSLERRGPQGILILGALLLALTVASIASILPATLLLAKHTGRQGRIADDILALIATAKAANNQALLAPLAQHAEDLGEPANITFSHACLQPHSQPTLRIS